MQTVGNNECHQRNPLNYESYKGMCSHDKALRTEYQWSKGSCEVYRIVSLHRMIQDGSKKIRTIDNVDLQTRIFFVFLDFIDHLESAYRTPKKGK